MRSGGPQPGRQAGVPDENNRRWNSILQLVLQAQQLPLRERRAFIESSEADHFVIQEALAILDGSESFASSSADSSGREERFVPETGFKIGRYRVEGLLGLGGSGTVYAAFDEELNRPVAIKFVSAGSHGNPATPTRPWREARAASALNHPNIIMIHEVIETSQSVAIVMELVQGVTLRQAVQKDPPLDQVLRWCLQLAQALAAAHSYGLIHGDIKPENVMVREDGYIKLLDFGLAIDAQTHQASAVQLAGTLRYLAPERYLGQPPTQAGDIFAFGVVLYELATGRYLFEAQNTLKLLQAITEEAPERARMLRPDLPPALDELISVMLSRTPEARPTAKEVAGKLAEIAKPTSPEAIPTSSKRVWLIGATVLALLLTSSVALWLRTRQIGPEFSRMTVRPLASQPGLEDSPSISPDGLWISCLYRARSVDRPILQIHSTQGTAPMVIDTGQVVPQSPASWSPDSNELIFTAMEGADGSSLYRVSRTGGIPRRIVGCKTRFGVGCEADWSPDGRALAILDRVPKGSELYLLDLITGQRRPLLSFDPDTLERPRFSPDGKWIAYSKPATTTNEDLYVIAVSGGQPRRITKTNALNHRSYTWSPDSRSLLSFGTRLGSKPQISRLPLDGSEPTSAGDLDISRGSEPSLARRKGSLVWVRNLSSNSLWRMPTDPSAGQPELLVNSAALDNDPEWSSHGRIVFRSDRSGFQELWIANADGSKPWQATRYRGPFVGDPHWSPDARTLAFTSHSTGNAEIFLMACPEEKSACSEPRQLTRSPATDANPVWSRDGNWIYFTSYRTGRYELWRQQANGGGAPEQITWNGGYMARESQDGRWLYYMKNAAVSEGPVNLCRIPLPLQGPRQTETTIATKIPFPASATWALGAREWFYYPSVDDPSVPFPSVRAVDLETGRTRDLPVGQTRLGRGLSLSPDGKWLLRSQNDRALTLVMIAE